MPSIADQADLKQVPGSNLVTVPVAINGAPKQFLLDIGTHPTRVSQAAVAELGLPETTKLATPIPLTSSSPIWAWASPVRPMFGL